MKILVLVLAILLLPIHTSASSGIDSISNTDLPIGAGGNRAMTIKPTGRVGIGTTDPQSMLDVNGAVNVQNDLSVMGDIGSAGNMAIRGNVGIGTTVPTSMLDVRGTLKSHDMLKGGYGVISTNEIPNCTGSDRALHWTNGAFACDPISVTAEEDPDTVSKPPYCQGTGQALRWNGAAWTCDVVTQNPPYCMGANQVLHWNGGAWSCDTHPSLRVAVGRVHKGACGAWGDPLYVGFNVMAAFAAPYSDRWTGGWHGAVVDNVTWGGQYVYLYTSIWGENCDGEDFNWIAFGYE